MYILHLEIIFIFMENFKPIENLEDPVRAFGKLLRDTREKNGKYRTDFTDAVGADKSSIERWEDGLSFPTPDKLPKIAVAYKLDLELLTKVLEESRKAKTNFKKARR
jgi:transcriptional regulator with XRE-family HTH domain